MGQWRGKLCLTLIVYAAGFATAVYMQTSPQGADNDGTPAATAMRPWLAHTDRPPLNLPTAGLEATPWVQTARAAVGKAAAFAKTRSLQLAEAITATVEANSRDRGDDRRTQTDMAPVF